MAPAAMTGVPTPSTSSRITQGTGSPASRRLTLDAEHAPGVMKWLTHHQLALGDLLRHPNDRDHPLGLVPLILTRHGHDVFVPGDEVDLQVGDEIVVAGQDEALDSLDHTLFHPGAVEYVATGVVAPETWLFRKLSPRVQDV